MPLFQKRRILQGDSNTHQFVRKMRRVDDSNFNPIRKR